MKSLTLIIAFLLVGSSTSKAQQYEAFIDTTKRWIQEFSERDNGDIEDYHYLFFFNGEVELDGQTYSVLNKTCSYYSLSNQQQQIIEEDRKCDTSLVAYLREDVSNKKLFKHKASPEPFDTCSKIMYHEDFQDPDAFPFEALAINFSYDSSDVGDTLVFTSYMQRKLEVIHHKPNLFFPGNDYYNFSIWGYSNSECIDLFDEDMETPEFNLNYQQGFWGAIIYPVEECTSWFHGYFNRPICFSMQNTIWFDDRIGASIDGTPGQCEASWFGSSIGEHQAPEKSWIQNPVVENTIQFLTPQSGQLTIQDPSGKIILSQEISGANKARIPKGLTGLYLVFVENNTGTRVVRAVVQ